MDAAAPSTEPSPVDLRSRFAVVSGHLRELADHPRSGHPAALLFRERASQVVTLLKAVYPRLQSAAARQARAAGSTLAPLPPGDTAVSLERQLQQAEQMLQHTWWQFGRLTWLEDCALKLRDVVDEVQREATVRPDSLRSLIQHILTNIREVEGPGLLLTEPGSSLEQWLPVRRRRSEPFVLAAGVESAVMTAWVALHFREWELDCESLMAAALLQDIGLLNLEHRFPVSARELQRKLPRIYRKHPEYSAALVAGIQQLSSRVPLAVAAHHEPAGGTGSMADRTLNPPEARWLQVIVRLRELRLEAAIPDAAADGRVLASRKMPVESDFVGQFGPASLGTALATAEPDTLDPAVTAAVLACFRLNAGTRQTGSSTRLPVLTAFGEKHLRRDAAHGGLSEPHIPLAGSTGGQEGQSRAARGIPPGRGMKPSRGTNSRRKATF
ncbi:MAG: hypothetical protein KDA79_06740 [Planctomycetaceae bacterium]|nr:hypothetical protein [Planctomycetaceae bacterium]